MDEPLNLYLPQRIEESKTYNPVALRSLISLYGREADFCLHRTLATLPRDERWVMPININNPYRIARALSAAKGNGILYYEALEPAETARLAGGDGRVLLDLATEPLFCRADLFEGLHEGAAEAGLPVEALAVVNSNMLSASGYAAHCEAAGHRERAAVIPFHSCLWLLLGHSMGHGTGPAAGHLPVLEASLDRHRRSRAFVSFNGRLRPHRLHTVLFLLARGLLEKGHVSFLGYHAGERPYEVAELEKMVRRWPFSAETSRVIPDLLARLPLTLDVGRVDYRTDKSVYKDQMPWSSPDPQYYLDSYFSIIVETTMLEPDMMFLTPISYKSIMNCHPFVYIGNAGALAELRRLGFHTFHPLIDESYDAVADPQDRMRLALLEAERLANLPLQALHDLYHALAPVLSHNAEHFWQTLPQRFAQSASTGLWAVAADRPC